MSNFDFVGKVDVSGVLEQLAEASDLWDSVNLRREFPGSPHTEMTDIWVRYADYRVYEAGDEILLRMSREHIPVWYPAWKRLPALRPIVHGLAALTSAEMIGGIFITKIPPGCKLDPHRDTGWHVDYYSKFYLSLQSEEGAVFGCAHEGQTEELSPKAGEIWFFDNRKLHWVTNDSPADRVTAIICLRTEQYPHG